MTPAGSRSPDLRAAAGLERSRAVTAIVLVVYVALAVAIFEVAWRRPGDTFPGDRGDPVFFIWCLGWVPHQVLQFGNPLYTTDLNHPFGANLMWNTSVVFPALVLAPITLAFGPVASYDVLVTAGLALSAWCAFLAARVYVRRQMAAGVAGLVYGFSPAMTAQSLGHPNFTVALFPPLVLLALDEVLVRRRRAPWRVGVLLGLAAAAQLLTGEELLLTTAVLAAVTLTLAAVLHPGHVRSGLGRLLPALAVGGSVALALGAAPLYVQFFGPQRVPHVLRHTAFIGTDLWSFLVPTSILQLTTPAALDLSRHFRMNLSEVNAYLGLPLILLLGLAVALLARRRPVVPLAGVSILLVALLALGPHLVVAGRDTGIPLPWAVVERLPLVDDVLPSRLASFVYLWIGIVLAVLLDVAWDRGALAGVGAGVAVAVALAPLVPRLPYPTSRFQAPAFFLPGGQVSHIPAGSVALVTPLAEAGSTSAMAWQAAAGYRFRMPEGLVLVPDPSTDAPILGPYLPELGRALTGLEQGQAEPLTPDLRCRALEELAGRGVGTVVAGPSAGRDRTVAWLSDLLERPPASSGGVEVWWGVDPTGLARARGCPGS
ncbi:MAG TPA: hypothetical protein VFD49_20805 [Candidatus Dormibacteraeota bacterium]|nr:hypothetical protein [Candidatus Dormibacteraeota bacterium]